VYEQGFSIPGLVNGFVLLGVLCLLVLAVAYAFGLRRSAIAPTEP
jgi:hypothetical protein